MMFPREYGIMIAKSDMEKADGSKNKRRTSYEEKRRVCR